MADGRRCIQCNSVALMCERDKPERAFCGRQCQVAAYALIEGKRTREEWEQEQSKWTQRPPITLIAGDGKRIQMAAVLLQYSSTLRGLLEDVVDTQEIELPLITGDTLQTIVAILEAWHGVHDKDETYDRYVQLYRDQRFVSKTVNMDGVLALAHAANHLDIGETDALSFVFGEIAERLTVENSFKTLVGLKHDLFELFLAYFAQEMPGSHTAFIAGIVAILIDPTPSPKFRDAIDRFLRAIGRDSYYTLLYFADAIIEHSQGNRDVYVFIANAVLSTGMRIQSLVSSAGTRTEAGVIFSQWVLETYFTDLDASLVLSTIIFCFSTRDYDNTGPSTTLAENRLRLAKLALTSYVNVYPTLPISHTISRAMEETLSPVRGIFLEYITWAVANFPTKMDYIALVGTVSTKLRTGHPMYVALLKLLAPRMLQQVNAM